MTTETQAAGVTLDTIVGLCKRRGFVFPSAEIYGGVGATYDYGPLGVELLRNVRKAWWQANVQERDDVVGLESALLTPAAVLEASGHVANFTDPLVDCKNCKRRWRADHLLEGAYEAEYGPTKHDKAGNIICPNCGGELTAPRNFNTMFKTSIGPVEETGNVAYLRPETAQGTFVNFRLVQESMRRKLPFGIAQVGKSFRNEIVTGNFVFRTLEFEQAELEFFVRPGTDDDWFAYWIKNRYEWYVRYGITPDNLRLYEHPKAKLSHYSKGTTDIEYKFPWGWGELEGIANRTSFDLTQHINHSKKDLTFYDEETKEHVTPFVIEPAAGITRTALIFLIEAYAEEKTTDDKGKEETRVVLRFHKEIAPIKVAVLPLSKKDTLTPLAKEIAARLRKRYTVQYDETQAIGRRYRRQDEIGTPYCVTVDFQSLDDHMVTIRERDSMAQERVPIADLDAAMRERFES